jgi:flagellar hook-basal body complex protein FliE
MSLIGSVTGLATSSSPFNIKGMDVLKPSTNALLEQATGTTDVSKTKETGFSSLLDNMIQSVDAKQTEANNITRKVLLGDSDQLHQSVIAMQEASVSFSLMVEVRNKLVDSYQELMRLPV